MKGSCSITDCGKPIIARGFCQAHYGRWYKYGNPLAGGTSPGEALNYLHRSVLPFDGVTCLLWPFARNAAGYAVIRSPGRSSLVSRLVCEEVHGAPPTRRHEARHLCGRGQLGCCAPKHLAWGTPGENARDKVAHGTDKRGEKSHLAKLTAASVLVIRKLRGAEPQHAIARRFGVSRATISHIHNGTTWGWLP